MLDGYYTLTGLTVDEALNLLQQELPPNAYKPVPNREYLTDISPAFMFEAVTKAFGPIGFGWYFVTEGVTEESEDKTSNNGREYREYTVVVRRLLLVYRLVDQSGREVESRPVIASGASGNEDLGDAHKGAVTNALGKAFSYLLWQLPIYKGEKDRPQKSKGGSSASAAGSPVATTFERPGTEEVGPVALRELVKAAVASGNNAAVSPNFGGFLRGVLARLFPDTEDAGLVKDKIHTYLSYLFGKNNVGKDFTPAELRVLRAVLEPEEVNGVTLPSQRARAEAENVVVAALVDAGQQALFDEPA